MFCLKYNKAHFLFFFFLFYCTILLSAPIEIISKSVLLQKNKNEFIIKQPIVVKDNIKIQADELLYNKKEKTAFFQGNIIAQSLDWILQADNAFIAKNDGEITFENLVLFNGSKWYIKAKRGRSFKNSIISLEDITLTQCNQDDPYWQFYLSSLEINNKKTFATGYNGVFFFHSVPLFYTPLIYAPTILDRKSGFLIPQVLRRESSNPAIAYGFRFKIPYFVALTQDHDLTITLDYIEKRGDGIEFEYNYAFLKNMQGRLNLWELTETRSPRKIEFEHLMEENDSPFIERYKVNYFHKQEILWGQQFFFEFIKNSDNEVNKDYFHSSTELDIAQSQKFSIIKNWTQGGYQFSAHKQTQFLHESRYNLDTNKATALNQIPQFRIFQNYTFFDKDELEFKFINQTINFYRQDGWRGLRNQFIIQRDSEFDFFDIFKFIPNIKYQKIDYQVHYNQKDIGNSPLRKKSFTYTYFDNDFELNFSFFRNFYNDKSEITKKLVLTPKIRYRFVSDFDQRLALDNDPLTQPVSNTVTDYTTYGVIFDPADRVYAQSNISFMLDTQLKKKTATKSVINLFSLSLIDTYNLLRKKNQKEQRKSLVGPQLLEKHQQTQFGKMRLPLKINLKFDPNDSFSMNYFTRYDHQVKRPIENKYSSKLIFSDQYSIILNYNMNQSTYQRLNGDLVHATKNFVVTNNYKWKNKAIITTSHLWENRDGFNLNDTYNKQNIDIQFINCCYRIILSLEQTRQTSTHSKEWDTTIQLKLNLADQDIIQTAF